MDYRCYYSSAAIGSEIVLGIYLCFNLTHTQKNAEVIVHEKIRVPVPSNELYSALMVRWKIGSIELRLYNPIGEDAKGGKKNLFRNEL